MNSLQIVQINIKSISPKKDILEHYLEKHKIDIALISETWLTSNTKLKFRNYKLLNREDMVTAA